MQQVFIDFDAQNTSLIFILLATDKNIFIKHIKNTAQ